MSRKPTLVFVPGAWHTASTWNKTAEILEAQQYKCIRVTLPSTTSNPSITLFDDIEAVRNAIVGETTQGRDVVVVVHSYGGAVGQSAIKGLARPKQDASLSTDNQTGYVVGLAMMATGFITAPLSFLDALGGTPPPFWKLDTENGFAVLTADCRELFYHDLPVDEGNYWVSQLQNQSLKTLTEGGEYAYAGWKDVPVWYLITTDDKTFLIEAQKMFAQMVKDAGGDITLREIDSSHSPMLSKPNETAEFISEAAVSLVR